MSPLSFLTSTDDQNNARMWRWVSGETPVDALIVSAFSFKDWLSESVRASKFFQSVQEDMLFASASISFLVYSVIFVAATAVAAVFIVPLMAMSFFFSGLVLVFSSLSYATFRMASSKYNHTVLFLNRLLRRLADNIPPSVGLVEIGAADKKELNLKESVKSLLSKLKRAEVRAEVRAPGATVDVQGLDSNAPVIVDEELTAATGATTIPDEQEFEDVPIQPLQNGAGPEPDTVKDGALNP